MSAKDGGDGIVQNDATQLALRIMCWGAPLVLLIIICFIVFFIKDYKAVCFLFCFCFFLSLCIN